MTIEDIKQLIAGDEHRTLELKKTTGELKDGMQSACAFLNTEGGWLIFGIAPTSLKIVGQMVTDNTQRELAQVLYLSTNLERWGTGVSRMVELCREQGVPEPEYMTDGHEVKVVFRKRYQYNSDENKNVNKDSDGGSSGGSGGSLAVAKRTLERNLADLQKKGILSRTGNTSAGRWMLLKESK